MPPSPSQSLKEKACDEVKPSVDAYDDADAQIAQRLVRRLDFRLLPCLALAYILTFIDRSNAGNARVAGLSKDASLGNWGFNIGTSLYYVLYLLCEIPAVMLVKRFGNHLIPSAIIAFGIITLGTAFINTPGQFYAVKVLLGMAEAFVLPGNAYIITQFYTREEVSARIGLFIFSGGFLSGAFGGLLASGLLRLPPMGPLNTWRHIFAWEGVITMGLGAILAVLYPSRPEKTRMLTEDERRVVLARSTAGGQADNRFPSWSQIRAVVFDPIVLVSALFYVINNVTVTGMSVFTPTILALNYPGSSPIQIQLYAVPPNIAAWILSLILITLAMRYKKHGPAAPLRRHSDRDWLRDVARDRRDVRAYGPIILAWTVSNARTDAARGLSSATISGIGALGSITGSWTYFPNDAPTGYHVGNTLNVSIASFVAVGISSLWMYEFLANRRAEKEGEAFRYVL
ncbi:Major facilitator superfamily transporter [Mycena kentingensis (nom. inval.)]|nr:Major facilitator superfamily transporter [Mycena kentingensis (nom. inval.)]